VTVAYGNFAGHRTRLVQTGAAPGQGRRHNNFWGVLEGKLSSSCHKPAVIEPEHFQIVLLEFSREDIKL